MELLGKEECGVVMATVDLLEYDFLVALTATTSALVEGRKCLLALHWAVVDVKRKAVSQPDTAHVRPRFDPRVLRDLGEKPDLESSIHSEPLATVIQQVPPTQFNKFIYDRFITNNLSFRIVTMGKELLGELLPYEAAAYGFKLVQHFQIYLNLQVAFEKHYGLSAGSLIEMRQALELPIESEGQGGRVECVGIAQVLCALLSCSRRVTRHRSRSPRTKSRTRLVRLKGTPYSTTEDDIRGFLRRCKVDKVVRVVDPFNRPTGDFIVRLAGEEDVPQALACHKEKIGGRYIEGKALCSV